MVRPGTRALAPALVAALIALCAAGGIGGASWLLTALPLLALALPLLARRYPGERRLLALARARRPRGVTAPLRVAARPLPRAHALVVRGGRLIACALGRRGPPRPLIA